MLLPGVGLGVAILLVASQTSSAAFTSSSSTSSGAAGAESLASRFGALGSAPFSVSADRLLALPESGRFLAEGHVLVERGGALLYADKVVFDQASGQATAEGDVSALDGSSVLSCRNVTMKIPELRGGLANAELRIKNGLDPRTAAKLEPSAWRHLGRDEAIVEAEKLERVDARRYQVEGASFTACDCGEDSRPSWRIRTQSASIDLDSGAWLTLPVFYVKDVPVFALPVFYLPLGERRSGLLLPHVVNSPATGPGVSLPFYLVLGDALDLTLDGRYLPYRGPAAGLELRYAPTPTTKGELHLGLVLDFGQYDAAKERYAKDRSDPIPRYAISARHSSALSERSRFEVELNMLGDPAYAADFADSFLSRQAEYSASRVVYTRTSSVGLRLALQGQLLQDLRPNSYAGSMDELRQVPLLSGRLPGPGAVRYRALELRQDAFLQALAEPAPLYGEARLSLQIFSAPRPEVPRFVRADMRPALHVPIELPLGLVLEPELALRLTAWGGRVEGEGSVSATRLAPIAKLTLHQELSRDFGAVVHRIRPELAYLLIPKLFGSDAGPFFTNDEIDQLGSVQQLRAGVASDLFGSKDGVHIAGVEAWLGRDLGVPGRVSERAGSSELVLGGDLALPFGGIQAGVLGRAAYALKARSLDELLIGASLDLGFAGLSAQLGRLGDRMPRYGFIAPEELVPSSTIDLSPYEPVTTYAGRLASEQIGHQPYSPFQGLRLGARLRPVPAFQVGVDVVFSFDDPEVLALKYTDPATGLPREVSLVRNTMLEVRYESPCQCWGAVARAGTARDQEGFFWSVALDLARLGGVSTGP